MITLEQPSLRVCVNPGLGAGVASFDVRTGEDWWPAFAQDAALPVASFLMVPFSNRLADGRFEFRGQTIQLEDAARHAIHGLVRKRPWEVRASGPTTTTLRFDWPGGAWPWPFTAEVTYRLEPDAFVTTLSVTNRSDRAMPAGLGFHPYFTRADAVVRFRVAGIYPDRFDTRIPSGPAEPVDARRDYSTARPLDPDAFMDFCAHGWDGVAELRWPSQGLHLDLHSDLGHLVFFNPPQPYFALEPVSNANDGFNLFARGDVTSGVRLVEPGATTTGTLTIRVRPATPSRP